MMRRHELDPISLTFGFAFTALGLLFLIGRADQALRLHWVWPLLLLALGVGILIDVTRTRPRPDDALTSEPTTTPSSLTPEPTLPDRDPEPTTAELDPDPTGGPVDKREHPI
jgi:hypothetical protein